MKITDEKTLADLQREFQQEYPYLKLAFYGRAVSATKDVTDFPNLGETLPVSKARNIHNAGFIVLNDQLTAEALRKTFGEIFGLHVQVQRYSFGKWVVPIVSDKATLREMNIRGMMARHGRIHPSKNRSNNDL